MCADALDFDPRGELFDLIILHDCIEHIGDFGDKARLLRHLRPMLSASGVLYVAFPPWQMPFGGHQQMSRNRFLAHLPWVHLLPRRLFALLFKIFGHSASDIRSFLEIRDTRLTVEGFERLASTTSYAVVSRQLYLVNPNYSTKFGFRPRFLPDFLARIPYLRNFLATTCYYILRAS